MTTATLTDHDRGTADLARTWGLSHDRLSREMAIREAAGLDSYRRIGRSRVVSPSQAPALRAWLERRGLLPIDSEDTGGMESRDDAGLSVTSRQARSH